MSTSVEIKDYVVNLICKVFEVSREDLLEKKRRSEDVVNARCALVYVATFEGLDSNTIERWFGIPANSQSYLLQCFELKKRSSPWFYHQMVMFIKEAKESSPIAFRAHNKDGEIVFYKSKYE